MKLSTVLLFSLLLFTIAQPIATRIVRSEDSTALINTTDSSKDTDANPASGTVAATTTDAVKPEKKHHKHTSKKDSSDKKHKHDKKHDKCAEEPVPATPPATPAAAESAQATDLLDAKIKQVQEETDKEIASLKAQKEKRVTIIKRQEELKRLNDQQKALADELAKLDDKPAEKAPEKPAPTPVTTEWKVEQTAKFNRYSTELADTIAMGESDDAELQDFKQIFQGQHQWFDTTMTSTKYVSDEGYAAINERTKCLELLVTAQKRAIPLLMKEVNMKKISKSAFDRLSTLLLYNLNAQINDEHAWNKTVPTEDSALIAVVKDTLTEAKDPAFNKQTPAQKALIELQKKLKSTQDLIEKRNRTVLELEMNIASNTEKLNAFKKDLEGIEIQKTKSETELKELQQKSADDISSLKAEKTKIESQLTQAQTEAKEAKTKLDATTADSTKTAHEKAELQSQSKELAKKVEDLQEKKHTIEQNLDEEQHKRRELEVQIEQAKFKQDQTESERRKLAQENDKLDDLCKELGHQVEKKNKQALELKLELERLRQHFASQKKAPGKRAKNPPPQDIDKQVDTDTIAAMRADFERQINDLKDIIIKQSPTGDSSKATSIKHTPEEKPVIMPPISAPPIPLPINTPTPPPVLTPINTPPTHHDLPTSKPASSLTPFPVSPEESPISTPAPVVKTPDKTKPSPEEAMSSMVNIALKPIEPLKAEVNKIKPVTPTPLPATSAPTLPGSPASTTLHDLPPPVATLPGDLSKKDVGLPKNSMSTPLPTPSAGPDLKAPIPNLPTPEPSKALPGVSADSPAPVAALPDYLNKRKTDGATPPAPSMPPITQGNSSLAEQNKQSLSALETKVSNMKPAGTPPAMTI